jgi:regulatory protein
LQTIYSKLLKLFETKDRTEKEIKDYLVKSGVSDSDIAFFISKLKDQKILNDERYVENYIRSKRENQFWGELKILHSLVELGVPSDLIQLELLKISKEEWKIQLNHYMSKKKFSKNNSKEIKKTITHLYQKGYTEDLINSMIQIPYEE